MDYVTSKMQMQPQSWEHQSGKDPSVPESGEPASLDLAQRLVVARDRWVASAGFTGRHFASPEYEQFAAAAEAFSMNMYGHPDRHHDELVEAAIALTVRTHHPGRFA